MGVELYLNLGRRQRNDMKGGEGGQGLVPHLLH